MKSQGASDELARTVAVNAITIGQIFYLLNSRYPLDSSLSLKAHTGTTGTCRSASLRSWSCSSYHLYDPVPGDVRHRIHPALGLALAPRWRAYFLPRRGG